MIQRREFWMIFLLGIVTCGIYYWYFLYQMTKDLNTMAGDDGRSIDPALAVLLNIITCGIYGWFWYYQMGNRVQDMGVSNNIRVEENGVTYLLWMTLGTFVLGIGPLIALYLFIRNFNNVATVYNYSTGPMQGRPQY